MTVSQTNPAHENEESVQALPMRFDDLSKLVSQYPAPFYLIDEKVLCKVASELTRKKIDTTCFENLTAISRTAKGKKGSEIIQGDDVSDTHCSSPLFFPLETWPNPYILKILAREGLGVFCQNQAELIMAQKAGLPGERILFYSSHAIESEYCYANLMQTYFGVSEKRDIPLIQKALGGLPEKLAILAGGIQQKKSTKHSNFSSAQTILLPAGVSSFEINISPASLIERAIWFVYHENYTEKLLAKRLDVLNALNDTANPRLKPMLAAGELLYRNDGTVAEIRRREELNDYFATLDFKNLVRFK